MLIKIVDIIGEYCSQRQNGKDPSRKGGEAIRELIVKNWDAEKIIEISFENVKVATPSFIDEAIGKLAFNYSIAQLRKKLKFSNINGNIKDKINKTIEIRLNKKNKESDT